MLRVILERSGGSVIVGYQMTTTKLARTTPPQRALHGLPALPRRAPPSRARLRARGIRGYLA